MQIIIKDLLAVRGGYLLNQVNCLGAYGSGVAGQLTKKWPKVRTEYMEECKQTEDSRNLLGTYLLTTPVEEFTHVVHLFGQYTFGSTGKHTNYTAFTAALAAFRLRHPQSTSCTYIPYMIGCGLGGGNWEHLQKIIRMITPDAYICVPSWHTDAPKPEALWCEHEGAAYVWTLDDDGDAGWCWSTATNGGNPNIHNGTPKGPPPPTANMLKGWEPHVIAARAKNVPDWTNLETGYCVRSGFQVIIPSQCARVTETPKKETKKETNDKSDWNFGI